MVFSCVQPWGILGDFDPGRKSREGSGWINGDRINGLFHLLINGVFLGVITPSGKLT